MKIFKDFSSELKSIDVERRTITAVASTETPDRYGDVVLQNGWVLDNFLKNPVIPWGHDYKQPPIAKAIDIRVEGNKLVFTAQFPEKGINPTADMVFDMYRTGFLKAFSVGFIPIEYEQNEYGGYTYKKQELLEISAVTVPANQEALVMAFKDFMQERKDLEEKAVVPYQDLPLADMDTEWDAAKARKNVAKWASSDGSGDKDKIDWAKYRKAFLWYDAENQENFGSYKLPIADVFDGKLKAVPKAIFAAAAAIQGARGGVDIPDADKEKIKKILEKYYKKMDRTPPWAEEMVNMEEILGKLDELKEELKNLIEKILAELDEIKAKLFEEGEKKQVEEKNKVDPEELKNLIEKILKEG